MVDTPQVGDRYKYNGINWSLISAKSMQPIWLNLIVVACDGVDVWYRFEGTNDTRQTSVERWKEIQTLEFHKGHPDLQKI